jgi:hypothetical protein
MKDTVEWKQNADLKDIVAVAAWILQLYNDVDPSDRDLVSNICDDYDTIWSRFISPMLLD